MGIILGGTIIPIKGCVIHVGGFPKLGGPYWGPYYKGT